MIVFMSHHEDLFEISDKHLSIFSVRQICYAICFIIDYILHIILLILEVRDYMSFTHLE